MPSSYSHLPLLLSDDLYLHPICELILIMFGGGGKDARCTARNGCYNIVFISAYKAVTNFYIISSHLWRVLNIVLCGGLVGWVGAAGRGSKQGSRAQSILEDLNYLWWQHTDLGTYRERNAVRVLLFVVSMKHFHMLHHPPSQSALHINGMAVESN